MKKKVIEFFQNLPEATHEQFNMAFELYRQSEGKNIAMERSLNVTGYTPSGLSNLLYDLQKMHGITDVEKAKVAKMEVVKDTLEGDGSGEVLPEWVNTSLVEQENEELKIQNEDLKYEKEELQLEKEELENEVKTLKLTPKLDAKAVRVEFPFLNEKDCPDELKILVADKITAWNRYLTIHEELARVESGEVLKSDEHTAELAKEAIVYFDENQKIYNELNAYQTTGKVLGLHPIFRKLQLTREVEEMTNEELVKYKNASAKYFSDNRKSLAGAIIAQNEMKASEIKLRVEEREVKLALVNKKLGIPAK